MEEYKQGFVLFIFRKAYYLVSQYVLASTFLPVILITIFFLILSVINFNHANFEFLDTPEFQEIFKFLGFTNRPNQIIGANEIVAAFGKISFLLMLMAVGVQWVIQIFTGNKIVIKNLEVWIGAVVITACFILAEISCFAPQAISGAPSVAPMLVFIWVSGILAMCIYTMIKYGFEQLNRIVEASVFNTSRSANEKLVK